LDIVKKIVPLTESSSPLGVSSWLRACLRPLCSCRAPEQSTCCTPLS